jgi:hypothetical protein
VSTRSDFNDCLIDGAGEAIKQLCAKLFAQGLSRDEVNTALCKLTPLVNKWYATQLAAFDRLHDDPTLQ